MELHFQAQSFSTLFTTTFFLLLLFFILFKVQKTRFRNNPSPARLPPGPTKLPFIGNLHHLATSLPHHALRDLALKHGPLIHLTLGQVPTVVVSSPEAAKQVMKTHDLVFASRPSILAAKIMSYDCTDIVFAPYGEYWRKLRQICVLKLLSSKRVQSFKKIREEEVSNLTRSIFSNSGSIINLSDRIFNSSYSITSRAALGRRSKDQEEFISKSKEAMGMAGGFCLPDLYPSVEFLQRISGVRSKLEKIHRWMDRILENIIVEHRSGDRGDEYADLVDVLLKVQEDEEDGFSLTNENIKAVILDIFSAGSETSATVDDWTMAELLRNPRIMKKAQDEVREVFSNKSEIDESEFHRLRYLNSVIKETLRLHPPAPLLLPRECGETCEIDGYEIPAKTKVIVNAWAIGRDSRYWIDAESYSPERFIVSSIDYKGNHFEYIPFGAGRRICPGMHFGLASLGFQLANLLYHFDWRLPAGVKPEDLDMAEAFGVTVRRKNDLYLIAIPYHHQST